MNYQHGRYDPPHGGSDVGRWQVHLAVDPSEKSAVQQAAPSVVPAETFEIRTELTEGGEGEVTLALRVFARTSEEATEEAQSIYSRLRAAAELAPAPVATLGYLSPWWRETSLAAEIGREAHELLKQGRHELAVIRMQTACELHISNAFEHLLRDHHAHASTDRILRGARTLNDQQQRALLHMLTGQHIQQTGWWPRYVDHLKRRNAIVHKGLAVNREDAQASIEVSLELRQWLLDVQEAPGADGDEASEADNGGPDDG